MSTPLDDFIDAARAAGYSEEYIAEGTAYITRLASAGYPVLFSFEHLAIEMRLPSHVLRDIVDLRRIKYSYFKLLKKRGGFREIITPERQLKFVQRWLLINILNKHQLSSACTGFRKRFSIIDNARVHERAPIILKVDLLKFYDTITEKRVWGLFKKLGYASNLALDLARLVTVHHGKEYWESFSPEERERLKHLYYECPAVIPQGAPTSPMIANIIAIKLDNRFQGLAEKLGFSYSRYADDLTFSSDSPYKLPSIEFIRKIIEKEGFFINDKKTCLLKKGMKQFVTGLTVTHGVHVSKSFRKDIYKHLYFSKKFGPVEHIKKLSEKENNHHYHGYQHWLLGCISFIYSVDKVNGKKMFDEFNKIDWAI